MTFLFLIITIWSNPDYTKLFGEDYQKAIAYCHNNKTQIHQKALEYQIPAQQLKAIIFPELIRHSAFQDFFETKALELAYVYHGKEGADFSIGHFQMKPSFVEKLELELTQNPLLQQQFQKIINYPSSDLSEMRKIRLHRLQNLDWQLDYLCCFYKIIHQKFETQLKDLTEEQHLKIIATAYNCGFDKSWENIQQWSKKACYPYGAKYPENQQYIYANIAWDYFSKYEN